MTCSLIRAASRDSARESSFDWLFGWWLVVRLGVFLKISLELAGRAKSLSNRPFAVYGIDSKACKQWAHKGPTPVSESLFKPPTCAESLPNQYFSLYARPTIRHL